MTPVPAKQEVNGCDGATVDDLHKLARAAVNRYARKCWWVSKPDLLQHAWLAMLEARRTFSPIYGVPFEGYAWGIIVAQLHQAVLRDSAPVSAPKGKLPDLRGLYREVLDEGLVDPALNAEEMLLVLEKRARMRAALEEILADERDHRAARLVLLNNMKARSVALMTGIPVARVYSVTRRIKDRIGNSYACWLLAHEGD